MFERNYYLSHTLFFIYRKKEKRAYDLKKKGEANNKLFQNKILVQNSLKVVMYSITNASLSYKVSIPLI